ncbi:endonuclease III [Flavihumibacter profundi]|uniref:endonuclease III n=1 Tax=Flavihumibacter profundi TaxID=2716883 RepID=UPI001CC7FEA6|nr:endonuclease III [Flavihumibacter profundi]MBZ5857913.1 endonuclease III [Flavihumibacter profundi]
MTTRERYQQLITYFEKTAPDAETELLYDNPFQLLVAVVLSAQCTDKRVNLTTPVLFRNFPDPQSLAASTPEEVLPYIKSISYPNNKAKHLVGLGKILIEKFKGQVPMTVDELVQIPGVGRKTANVITSVIDAQPNMAVDTHVFRVSERIGLTTRAKTPLAAEKQLLKYIPKELVHKAHHWLILHGRYVCTARSPKCESCGLQAVCRFYNRQMAKSTSKTTHGK